MSYIIKLILFISLFAPICSFCDSPSPEEYQKVLSNSLEIQTDISQTGLSNLFSALKDCRSGVYKFYIPAPAPKEPSGVVKAVDGVMLIQDAGSVCNIYQSEFGHHSSTVTLGVISKNKLNQEISPEVLEITRRKMISFQEILILGMYFVPLSTSSCSTPSVDYATMLSQGLIPTCTFTPSPNSGENQGNISK